MFLLLSSIALRDWRLSILLLPIASLFFLSNNLFPLSEINAEVTREVSPARIVAGRTTTVRLEVTNKGKKRIDFFELYDRLPAKVQVEKGSNHLLLTLDPGKKTTVNYEILCPLRGRYEIGPACLRTRDSLGLHFTEKTLTEPSIFYVLPEVEYLKATDLRARHTGPWPGIFPSRHSGVGTEFYGLRDYVPGDALSRVGWKASARMAKLITIDNESERSTDIMIILDAGRGSTLGVSPNTLLEYEVRAAGSLASLLLNLGNRVGLIIHGGVRSSLPRDFGKRHFQTILNRLATAEAGETPLPIGFEVPVLMPPDSQVILISPLLDPHVPEAVRTLASEGYDLLIISPSVLGFPSSETSEASRIVHRIMALERGNTIAELRRYGTVVDWDPRIPLRVAMRETRRWRVPARH